MMEISGNYEKMNGIAVRWIVDVECSHAVNGGVIVFPVKHDGDSGSLSDYVEVITKQFEFFAERGSVKAAYVDSFAMYALYNDLLRMEMLDVAIDYEMDIGYKGIFFYDLRDFVKVYFEFDVVDGKPKIEMLGGDLRRAFVYRNAEYVYEIYNMSGSDDIITIRTTDGEISHIVDKFFKNCEYLFGDE